MLLVAPTDLRRCLLPHGCSGRRRARPPARLGDLTSFGAAPRSPPVPSGPSGALHTGGAGCADDWLGVSSRSPARPCRRVACFVGLGRCVCRWAAARPRDRHTRASLGVVDLEARPGPAAAHRHRGRAPVSSTPVGPSRLMVLGASARCPARHRRLNPRRPVILARHHAPDCWGLSSGHARNTGITLFSCPRSVI